MQNKIFLKFLVATLLLLPFSFASANERAGTLMVHLTFDSGYFAIKDTWVVNANYPVQSGAFAGRSALIFQLTDSDGNEISRIKIRDPSIIRGPLLSPEHAARLNMPSPHHIVHKQRGSVVLRFPQYQNVRYINLLNPQAVQYPDTSGRFAATPAILQQMDLLNY